jgi:hypothetical protein
VVGDHRSAGLRDTAENVEAGTEGARDFAIGLPSPTLVARSRLTGEMVTGVSSAALPMLAHCPGNAALSI